MISAWMFAAFAARSTSASLTSGRPYVMFSRTEQLNKNGFWLTNAICERNDLKVNSLTLTPSMVISPSSTS